MKANPTGYQWSKYECFLKIHVWTLVLTAPVPGLCLTFTYEKTKPQCDRILNDERNVDDHGNCNSPFCTSYSQAKNLKNLLHLRQLHVLAPVTITLVRRKSNHIVFHSIQLNFDKRISPKITNPEITL